MPTQFLDAFKGSLPSSPSISSMTTNSFLFVFGTAVTISPSPYLKFINVIMND